MNSSDFFDNCHIFFEEEDEETNFVDIKASLYRDEDGKMTEIRFFNETYDEFMVVDRDGKTSFISVPDVEEIKLKLKNKK